MSSTFAMSRDEVTAGVAASTPLVVLVTMFWLGVSGVSTSIFIAMSGASMGLIFASVYVLVKMGDRDE